MRKGKPATGETAAIAYGVSVLALVLLCPASANAYSLKTTAAGYHVRWWDQTIRMTIDPALERAMEAGQARQAAVMAAEAWRGLPGVPDIVVEPGAAPGFDPERRTGGIYLVRRWTRDPRELAVTVSSYTPDGKLMGTDILINGSVRYDLLSETGEDGSREDPPFDLASVLTHEMGHVLGLDENLDDETATMAPHARPGETHQRTLTEDDEEGVIELYSASLPRAALSCSLVSLAGSPAGGADTPVLLLALLGLAVGARARRRVRVVARVLSNEPSLSSRTK